MKPPKVTVKLLLSDHNEREEICSVNEMFIRSTCYISLVPKEKPNLGNYKGVYKIKFSDDRSSDTRGSTLLIVCDVLSCQVNCVNLYE